MVKCRTGHFYTGITVDIDRRVKEHNRGVGSKFTRSRRPVTLVYVERCGDRTAALKRERQIKKMSRAEKVSMAASQEPSVRPLRLREHTQGS